MNPRQGAAPIDPELITQIVAIDGPAGAGKSTVARRVAERLGFAFLDTGAMYRAATWWAMRNGVDMTNESALVESTQMLPLELREHDGALQVLVAGEDVSQSIRRRDVTENIRLLDGIPAVRAPLVRLQRQIGCMKPTVAEGRDIGTVVFPRARCKVYLDASIDERARRRAKELESKGEHVDDSRLQDEILRRDENDRGRACAPLRQAEDAVRIDTSGMTLDEVVESIVQHAKSRL